MRRRLAPLLGIAALAMLSAAALPAFADDAADKPIELTPLQIGQIFCIAIVGNDMAPVEALTTASLQKAIAKADALNTVWMKKNPDEKPPLGDGLPWQEHADYASGCTAKNPTDTGKEARVDLTYHYPEAPDADYTNTLVLKPVPNPEMGDNFWRIDDIAFDNGSGMKQDMIDAFKP